MPFPDNTTYDLLSGVLTTTLQLVVGEWVAVSLKNARSPMDVLGKAFIDLTPGPVVDITVALVEEYDKVVLGIIITGLFLSVGVVIGTTGLQTDLLGHGLPLALGVSVIFISKATGSHSTVWPSIHAATAGTLAGMAVWFILRNYPVNYLLVAGLLLTGALSWEISRQKRRQQRLIVVSLPPAAQPLPHIPANCAFDIPGISPLLTNNDSLYVTDTTFFVPIVELDAWRLRVSGCVETPYELTWAEFLKLPLVELDAALVCVHNPVGGPRIGNARWLGVPLTVLLEKAAVQPNALQLVVCSSDGFSVSIPLSLLDQQWPALVVVGMNGKALSPKHGFPARLLIPGVYGYSANIKWLSSLEITDGSVKGYWEKRGWPNHPGWVQPQARIDTPADLATLLENEVWIAGVAWSPPAGVQAVEVSINNGPWQLTQLAGELAPTAWRHWRWQWRAKPGQHTLQVRTIGRRSVQRETAAPPYPDGASGIHTIQVTVLPAQGKLRPQTVSQRLTYSGTIWKRRIHLAIAGIRAWKNH